MKINYKKEYFNKLSEKNSSTLDHYKDFLKQKNILLKDKKIADFGCARGLFFEDIMEDNECTGYDISSFAIDFCKEKFKKGSFELFDLNKDQLNKENNFDLIILLDTIEHLDNLSNLKNVIRYNLKNNGFLVITTPNANSFLRFLLGKKNYTGEMDKTHTILFTPYTLDFFLRRCGLQKITLSTPYSFYFNDNLITKTILYGGQIFAIYKKY